VQSTLFFAKVEGLLKSRGFDFTVNRIHSDEG